MPKPIQPTPDAANAGLVPAAPTCKLPGIAAFKPGSWDGKPVTAADLRAMVDNWQTLSKPQGATGQPYYVPFVSLKHNDILACGSVARAYMQGDTLTLDGTDIPEAVGALRNSGRLHSPSIEFWNPGDFVMPNGKPNTTPVLKCVTLLGGDAPAVKGLGPLPAATYSHHGPTRRFAAKGNAMDRTAMIAALQAAGVDTSTITDAIPDEFLAAVLKWVQAQAQANPPGAPAGNPVPMADPAITATATPTAPAAPITVPTIGGGGGPAAPTSLTLKFADGRTAVVALPAGSHIPGITPAPVHAPAPDPALAAFINATNSTLAALSGRQNAIDKVNADRLGELKRQKIRQFCDRMTDKNVAKMAPAQVKGFAAAWEKLDDVRSRKFSDGKRDGSELDEALADYESTAPVIRQFSEIVRQGNPGLATAGGAGVNGGVTPESRREILSGTVAGRAILQKEDAAARTKVKAS